MAVIETLTLARKEVGASTHIPITHLVTPMVFETQAMQLGTVIQIQGVPFDTQTNETLNHYQQLWHAVIKALPETFGLYATLHRKQVDTALPGSFTQDFAKKLNAKYQQQFESQPLFQNTLYLTLVYKGLTAGKAAKGLRIGERLKRAVLGSRDSVLTHSRQAHREAQLQALNDKAQHLCQLLANFGACRLGERDNEVGHSELLAFLGLLVNGGETIPFRQATQFPAFAKSIDDTPESFSQYPTGNLAQYLLQTPLCFGEAIQWQGAGKDRFGAIVSVKRYGEATSPIIFDPLLLQPSEFIATHSYFPEPSEIVLKKIQQQRNKLLAVEDMAHSQVDELVLACDDIASGQVAMGAHHHSLLVLANSLEELTVKVNEAIKCYQQAGFTAVRESLAQEPAFWAQIPGNQRYIPRASLITSRNFADFFPLHNYATGFRDGNHLGGAAMLLATPSRTPYFFNCHVPGSQDNPSKGHTLVFGGNGSGKTVFLAMLAAQLNRYQGRAFFFDRDRGLDTFVRAMGGHYSILSPNHPQSTRFNPFQLPDTPVNRQFCREWLGQLVKGANEETVPAAIQEALNVCVDYAFDELDNANRRLSHVSALLPIDFPRWPQLRPWLKNSNGHYAYLFDNEDDAFVTHDLLGFDVTHFLDNEPASVRTPVMMYLFHQISTQLDGRLTSLFLDEGHQYLDDAYWERQLKVWLPTLRKRNAHIILSTQSPTSIAHSPIAYVLKDNVATSLYFPNPQADTGIYCDSLGLTETEFSFIKDTEPHTRLFLVKQHHESALCRLDLSHMTDVLPVLSGSTQSVLLADKLRAEYGKDWLTPFMKTMGGDTDA
ncbi:MAG: hypothetical protein CMF50_03780 [Legionellales bacterium]|nr:hypothetical protein [Legionellales bacterium]|tara:strand:+ start:8138 stop:10624 length:2487 start_codon:yes stop_codon:yes gene_type:complete